MQLLIAKSVWLDQSIGKEFYVESRIFGENTCGENLKMYLLL